MATHWLTMYCLTLPKLCIMVLDHMIQEHNLGAAFHRSTVRNPKSRERAVLAKEPKYSVTGVVAIPSVIFFPAISLFGGGEHWVTRTLKFFTLGIFHKIPGYFSTPRIVKPGYWKISGYLTKIVNTSVLWRCIATPFQLPW